MHSFGIADARCLNIKNYQLFYRNSMFQSYLELICSSGKNNAGKSSFLEAIYLHAMNSASHRSIVLK